MSLKIQLASDLHLEFLQSAYPGERLIEPVPGADVLVLAGDIAGGSDPFKLFAKWSAPLPIPVIFIAGNHEFYGRQMEETQEKMIDDAARLNIFYLEKEAIEIGDVRFLGTTLWTDYRLKSNFTQSQLMKFAQRNLNDHVLIRTEQGLFSPEMALAEHELSRAWLAEELAKPFPGKTVVVTHHGPHPKSVHPRYQDDPLSSAFNSDLSELMPHADLWLHGHVHDSFDYQVGRCRVVANPAGYIQNRWAGKDKFLFENEYFDPQLLVEV